MWKYYSFSKLSKKVVKYSDFKKQFSSVKVEKGGFSQEIVCSPINYIDFQNERNLLELLKLSENLTDAIFIKDSSFGYENEFRVVVKENEREIEPIKYKPGISKRNMENLYNSTYNYPGIQIPLANFEDYNFEIVHHPKSDQWVKEKYLGDTE